MIGYFFFGITLIIVIIFTVANISEPTGGQNNMGTEALAFLALGTGFTISSLILTLCVGSKGGFDWVSDKSGTRNLLVGIGWLCMVVATFACMALKWDKGVFPPFLVLLGKSYGQTWIPLLMLVAYFYLLSADLRASVSPNVYKIPLTIAFGLTVIMTLSLLFVFLRLKIEKQTVHKKAVQEAKMEKIRKYGVSNPSWYFESSMDDIIRYKEKTITGLLYYTFNDNASEKDASEKIRNAAIAKIKSYEYWETDLIHILEGKEEDSIYNVYGFLDGNKIEHREKFILPIKNSITQITSIAHKSIKDPDDLGLGATNIVALCRILDAQFKDSTVAFRPSIITLQQVLEMTPAKRKDTKYAQGFDEVLQASRLAVKNWLAVNQ
jgi:hypothetical protein